MKKILISILVLIAAAAIIGCVQAKPETNKSAGVPAAAVPYEGGQAGAVIPGMGSRQSGISVTGEGKAATTPDIALLGLGVEAQSKSVGDAQNTARQAMSRVRQALSALGVEDKDIKTISYAIQPVYQYIQRENRQELIGYRVSDRISVKIRKISDAGKVIDAAAEAGGNNVRIDSIGFTVNDPTPQKNEAREKAVRDAMAKARQMAELAGVKLGKAMFITESGFVQPPPRPFPMPMAARAEAIAAPTEISPGEAEIQVQVQILFAIE